MSQFWLRLTGAVLLLVLLFALFLVAERWRGHRVLTATIADLKAQGALPTPEELFMPPGASNGIHLLVAAAGRLGTPPSPPSMQGVFPGRAVPSFRRVWWEASRGQSNTWDDLAEWRQAHAAELEQIHQALALPDCRATVEWKRGFKMLVPHLAKQKGAATALGSAALFAARQSDKEGAVTCLADLRRLEQALAREPVLISQLVRIACASLALPRVWDILQRDDWTEPDLKALQSALPSSNYSEAVVESLRGETALWEVSARQMGGEQFREFNGFVAGEDDLTLPGGLDDVPSFAIDLLDRLMIELRARVLFPVWRFAWREQAIAFHLRAMDELVRRSREAGAARNLRLFRVDDIPGLRESGWYDQLRYQLTYATMPVFPKALSKALRLETERALMETGLALRRFELRRGHHPERLEELVPDYLVAVPVDGMNGQPLHYRANTDGTYTLWSVGEDFEDNGGDSTPLNPSSVTLRWWNAKDAVLPVRASDEEFAKWSEQETARWAKSRRPGGSKASALPMELMRRYGLVPTATNVPASPK